MRSGHHISSQLPATDPPRRGPSFHALSASRLPVPPQKHASREQRLREKVSYTFFEKGGGAERASCPPPPPFCHRSSSDRYPSRYTYTTTTTTTIVTFTSLLVVEDRNVASPPMNPFLRVARGNEERRREGERERRIVSRDRLFRGTTVSDSSIESVGLVALSASLPPRRAHFCRGTRSG